MLGEPVEHWDTLIVYMAVSKLDQITELPTVTIDHCNIDIPDHVHLADPTYYECESIDILLGVDIFWELLCEGRMRLSSGPFLQNTKLGWIISGPIYSEPSYRKQVQCYFTQSIDSTEAIDTQLRKFWEIEQLPIESKLGNTHMNDEERACEEHFVQTTARLSDGRFSVRIPFKHSPDTLAPQLLLYTVREAWWPVAGRSLARRVVHACVTCARLRAQTLQPIMGNLPAQRLQPRFPFERCGVDYAGPVLILNRKGRGAITVKAYICIFVCFVTRAVHLELASDLSSEAYILVLKRFISRRNKPAEIFSDNGKNFVGANNELSKFLKNCSNEIKDYATSQSIKFHTIPPYASHFGGLWERGVKSCKHHLRRVVGNAHLTFEEFTTALTQVEAILNSRPLTPLSSDPNDFLPLTPAHFLVGRPLTAPATADLRDKPMLRLTRYQRVEQIRQHFWARWSKEYVSELQQRIKWRTSSEDLKEHTMVLIKDDNLPPLKWSLGRITRVYPGRDGISRVADIRTANGTTRRAFSKICPLPVDDCSC
ncbi:unnamed protein product [Plutella xylostella]|uniref:(diamondback moth) hypothetical protein n=1 Tax=Plutella xylostella TaxID=51655 RepID=A0A8S4FPP8_PLUXY|nr:unnamed protein product [Plutella xylostella]